MAEATVTTYKPEILILCGLPGSGKTTEALDWVAEDPQRRTRISWDELRLKLFPGTTYKFSRANEDKVKRESITTLKNALKLGMSVVIDNTNLTPKARQVWKDIGLGLGVTVTEREIDTDVWTCIERDTKRSGRARVGRAVIERMALFNGFLDFSDRKTYPYEGFVICDLDGTLADIEHRRHFVSDRYCSKCKATTQVVDYETRHAGKGSCSVCHTVLQKDWRSFFADVSGDALNAPVAELLDMFGQDGYGILLVSGRPIDSCGLATQDWLANHEIKYDHLFMRNSGDSRSDVIVKQEILDLLPLDMIDYVLDDRKSVVEMWRKNGLFCLQVADGDF